MAELLGTDPSVAEVAAMIATRASGNPFFAEEMVRDLHGRGVLQGQPGAYLCTTPITDVSVPATVQAAIAARIDRLPAASEEDIGRRRGDRRAVHRRPAGEPGLEPVLETSSRPSSSTR